MSCSEQIRKDQSIDGTFICLWVLHIYSRTFSDKPFCSILSKIYSRVSQNFIRTKTQILVSFKRLFIGGIMFEIQKSYAKIVQQDEFANATRPLVFTVIQYEGSQICNLWENPIEPHNLVQILHRQYLLINSQSTMSLLISGTNSSQRLVLHVSLLYCFHINSHSHGNKILMLKE